jgi:hypothetical protein
MIGKAVIYSGNTSHAGANTVRLNITDLPPGIYLCKMNSKEKISVAKFAVK